jgi:hypothetical protein
LELSETLQSNAGVAERSLRALLGRRGGWRTLDADDTGVELVTGASLSCSRSLWMIRHEYESCCVSLCGCVGCVGCVLAMKDSLAFMRVRLVVTAKPEVPVIPKTSKLDFLAQRFVSRNVSI